MTELIQSLIGSCCIVPRLSATEKTAAFMELLGKMVDSGQIARSHRANIKKLLIEREEQGSTGLGDGIAIPHVKGKIETAALGLGNSVAGIPYDAIDGKPVHTVFMLVAPEDDPQGHLQVLRWVSGLARSPDFRRFVLAAETEETIRELLEEMSEGA